MRKKGRTEGKRAVEKAMRDVDEELQTGGGRVVVAIFPRDVVV